MTEAVLLDRKFAIVREDLHRYFDGKCPADAIDQILDEVIAELEDEATVENFLPVLAEREASERIRALVEAQGGSAAARKEILFADQHGSGRSQIAAALVHEIAGDDVFVRCIGLTPDKEINPHVLRVLRNRGINTEALALKTITPRVSHRADVVVLMGIDEVPNVPGTRYVEWDVTSIEDAAEEEVEQVVDEIEVAVRKLLVELQVLPAA